MINCSPALWRRAGIGLCLALFLGFGVSYVALLAHGDAGPKQSDFLPYYAAGTLVATGHGSQIYERKPMASLEKRLVSPLRVRDGIMPFLYPAYFAGALAPLSLLPYDTAYIVWLVLNVLLLFLVLAGAKRWLRLTGSSALLFGVGGLSFFPVLLALAQGQTSIILLTLFFGGLAASRRGDELACGALLALALIKPPYVLPVLLVLMLHRRWRVLPAFVGVGAFLLATPALLLGPAALTGFVDTMVRAAEWSNQIGGFQPQFNQSFSGLSHLLFPDAIATVATLTLDAAAICLLVAQARRSADRIGIYGLAVLVGLLVGPHVLLHDLTLLLIPVITALASQRRDRPLAFVVAGGYALVIAGLPAASALHLQLSVVAMTALALWMAARNGAVPLTTVDASHGRVAGALSPSTVLEPHIMRSINADR